MLSVVVCSIDPEKQQAIRAEYERAAGEPHEFILINDARSLAEGYNRGFAQSRGEIIVFSHDDIEIHSTGLGPRLCAALEKLDLVGVAGTSRLAGVKWVSAGQPYLHGRLTHVSNGERWVNYYGSPSNEIEALDGVFLAARKTLCAAVPFDQTTFDGFHFYDLDFTHRAFLAGFKVGTCDLDLVHHSVGSYDDENWQRYAERFLAKHRRSLRPNLFRSDGPQWSAVRVNSSRPPSQST